MLRLRARDILWPGVTGRPVVGEYLEDMVPASERQVGRTAFKTAKQTAVVGNSQAGGAQCMPFDSGINTRQAKDM